MLKSFVILIVITRAAAGAVPTTDIDIHYLPLHILTLIAMMVMHSPDA